MKTGLLLAAAAIALAAPANAGLPYSALYAFGDSLSDVGNLYLATPFIVPGTPPTVVAKQPLFPYAQGRFSNGAVWVQDLSAGLGLGPVLPSLAGGNDYAFGGASTGTTDVHAATAIDLPTQVAAFGAYLATHPTVDPSNALFTLSIGANDLFAVAEALAAGVSVDTSAVIAEAAANVAAEVNQLRLDGARKLVLFDVPNLGVTPRFNHGPGLALQGAATALSLAFDLAVQQALVPVESAGLEVTGLDTFHLITAAVGPPQSPDFANVTAACWTGTDTGGPSSGTLCSPTFAGQNQYLFWDDIHPTAGGHLLVANDALGQLGFPALTAPVPEPAAWAMMVLGFAGLGALGARRARAAA